MSDFPPPIPPPVPGYLPAPYPSYQVDPRKKDLDQLRLLSIFSYVSAGLALLGIAFLVLHYTMMHAMMSHPEIFNDPRHQSGPNPAVMFKDIIGMLSWFYLAFGLWGVVAVGLNVVSGYFLGQRRHRTFSMVVAGLNCLRIPLGTALGVCSLLVLMRDSVRQLYEDEDAGVPGKRPS